MNSKKSIFVALISLSLFAASESKAAFPVKRNAYQTEITNSTAMPDEVSTVSEATSSEVTAPVTEATHATKKHSFFSRVLHKIGSVAEKAAISQALYIILSIFWLGWLAIGINDNFEGYDWLIALLLYCLFWLPGFIYSLIMMGNYY